MTGTTAPSAPVQGTRRTPAAVRRQRRRTLTAYTYLLPYVLLLVVFGVIPAAYGLFLSFTDTTKAGTNFSGLDNFIIAFSDFRFWPAFANVGLYIVMWLPMMLVGVVGLALLLQARVGRLSAVVRLLYYLPGAVTGAASVLLWTFVLDPTVSPFGWFFRAMGWQDFQTSVQGWHMNISMALMSFSIGAGGWIIIVFGAFQSIPVDVLDAASIDGAGPWRQAIFIKIPLIQKYLVYMLILSFAGGTQLFVEPQLLASAAPAGTVNATWSPNLLGYEFAFNVGNFGVASAIATVLLLISLAGAALLVFKTRFFEVN